VFDDWSDEDSLSDCYDPEEETDELTKIECYKSPIY